MFFINFVLFMLFSSFIFSFSFFILYFFISFLCLNLKLVWFYSYLFLLFMFMFFMVSLMFGSVPFNYILGSSGLYLFFISFLSWFLSYFGGFFSFIRFHSHQYMVVIFLFIFDSFVTLLRPVTLTLRVFINVSLGHFLIMMLHLNMYFWIILVWLL